MARFTSSSVIRSRSSSSAERPAPMSRELTKALVEVEILDVLDVGLLGAALGGAIAVYEGVGEDPVQPCLQVGAFLEGAEGAVGLQKRLLHEVFGIGRVPGHAKRSRVQRRHVLHCLVGELRPGRPCAAL